MTWWQRVLNFLYRSLVYLEDGTRLIYFPREDMLRYVVPEHPRCFTTFHPKAALWIPLFYEKNTKILHIQLASVITWEIPVGQALTPEEKEDIRRKIKHYVSRSRGRFVVDELQ